MKTVFSLLYFEASKFTTDLPNKIHGPFLFQTESAAQEALLNYIRHRFATAYLGQLVEHADLHSVDIFRYTRDDDSPMTSDEAMLMLMSEQEKLNFHVMSSWYSEIANENAQCFHFSISELPDSSFIEEAIAADAIEINDNFVRDFHITMPDKLHANHSIFIETSVLSGEGKTLETDISLSEAQNAIYCPRKKLWQVGNLDVSFIKFQR